MPTKIITGAEATKLIRALRSRIAALEAELDTLHKIFKKHVETERKKAEAIQAAHETDIIFLKGQIARLKSAKQTIP